MVCQCRSMILVYADGCSPALCGASYQAPGPLYRRKSAREAEPAVGRTTYRFSAGSVNRRYQRCPEPARAQREPWRGRRRSDTRRDDDGWTKKAARFVMRQHTMGAGENKATGSRCRRRIRERRHGRMGADPQREPVCQNLP
jgi:hypothetical protein